MTAGVAPDYAEAIEAWRVWRVEKARYGLRLQSVFKDTLWQPGVALVADCLRISRRLARRPHLAPVFGCECGIYAARLTELDQYLADQGLGRRHETRVFGRVALWGRVVECERGWRAECAYPSHLYVPTEQEQGLANADEVALWLSEYGVAVELIPEVATEAVRSLAASC